MGTPRALMTHRSIAMQVTDLPNKKVQATLRSLAYCFVPLKKYVYGKFTSKVPKRYTALRSISL